MFTLTLAVGSAQWPLVFKTEEGATTAMANIHHLSNPQDRIAIVDDFGQTALIQTSGFHGALLEDMEKVKLAHIERQLYAAKLQIATQKAAQSDPTILAHQRGMGSSASILTPGGLGNGMRPI